MILLVFIGLYIPIYFGLNWALGLPADWVQAGVVNFPALAVTFGCVVLLHWLKDRIWG